MDPRTYDNSTYEPDSPELHELDLLRPSVTSFVERSEESRLASASIEHNPEAEAERPLVHHECNLYEPQARTNCADGEEGSQRSTWKKRSKFKSWKVAVLINSAIAAAVLLANCILTIWASLHFGFDRGSGNGAAYDGDCDTVAAWSRWLHVVVNVLSTMLLGASSYAMQCATAPTRSECDRAHARGDWFDIGVMSVRNLTRLGWRRPLIWCLLALSSIPIHLLYNSAIFQTTDNNDYSAVIAGEDFLSASYNFTTTDSLSRQVHRAYLADPASWANLTRRACVQSYTNYVLSGRTDVIAVFFNNYTNVQARTVNKDSTDLNKESTYLNKDSRDLNQNSTDLNKTLTDLTTDWVPKLSQTYDW